MLTILNLDLQLEVEMLTNLTFSFSSHLTQRILISLFIILLANFLLVLTSSQHFYFISLVSLKSLLIISLIHSLLYNYSLLYVLFEYLYFSEGQPLSFYCTCFIGNLIHVYSFHHQLSNLFSYFLPIYPSILTTDF